MEGKRPNMYFRSTKWPLISPTLSGENFSISPSITIYHMFILMNNFIHKHCGSLCFGRSKYECRPRKGNSH